MIKFINRAITLESITVPGNVQLIYGPRRAGKTTLLKSYLASCGLKYRLETGDDIRIRHLLGSGGGRLQVAIHPAGQTAQEVARSVSRGGL